jgi:tetratricopeptide (TPR) repeat protein
MSAILAGLALAAAVVAAYADGLRGPLVLDDGPAITGNASIVRLWPPWGALHPPLGTSVSGRPVANLTLAMNHAAGGTGVWGYHALNVAIHALATLALYGVVRRTLRLPSLAARWGKDAVLVAAAVAAVWALHPLQTEAVTYVVQRVESLMGLFFLLTFYCFVRGVTSPRAGWWQAGAVLACLLGMATKEVMVAAPVLLLLYDRAFVSGSLAGAARKRPVFYGCLAGTWVLLAGLVAGMGGSRQNAAGFTGSVSPVQYWWTQFEAVSQYLRLTLWPRPLSFDYGPALAGGSAGAWLCALLVVGLLAAAFLASRWRPAVGFLGLWFFALLAPTSLVPVATQTIAEHRMYLPLAAIAAGFVLGICALLPTWGARWLVLVPVAAALGLTTARRNLVYGSELSLWGATVASSPDNARAHCSYGLALSADPRNRDAAIAEFEAALRLHPNYSDAHLDLGNVLAAMPGRLDEAIAHYQQALAIRPDLAEAENNLGLAYAEKGEPQAAVEALGRALRLQPQYAEAAVNLGLVQCRFGHLAEGIETLQEVVQRHPDLARAQFLLGNGLVQTGQTEEAIGHFKQALSDQPDFAAASNSLGVALCRSGRNAEGIAYIDAAIRLQPAFAEAHFARGLAMMQERRRDEARQEFQRVLTLRPGDRSATRMLEVLGAVP